MKWTKQQSRRTRKTGRKRSADLSFDQCEDRTLLSLYTVTKTVDDGTAGTLRAVITDLNQTGTATNTIRFQLGAGLQTMQITQTVPLAAIARQVSIEGYTQDTSTQNTALVGSNAVIHAELNLNGHAGLSFSSGATGSTVTGLSIFGGTTAIDVGASNMVLAGNFLGIRADGTSVSANTTAVLVAAGATGVVIGGALTTPDSTLTALGGRNLIAGNTTGISIAADGVSIVGNFFGTDNTGLNPAANGTGVSISGSGSTVGGAGTNDPNVFGTNTTAVALSGDLNTVQGNTFGAATAAGTLGNTLGIAVTSSTNLISGNTFGKNATGVSISGAVAAGNQLFGNTVGIGTAGANVGNVTGVAVDSTGNSIGGAGAGQGNTFGFNTTAGIRLTGAGNNVLNNLIGVDSVGNARGNAIGVDVASATNLISGNTIAFNTGVGVQVTGAAATGNLVTHNSIFQNTGLGIDLTAGGNGNQAAPVIQTVNTLGGTTNVTVVTTGMTPGSIIEVFSGGPTDPLTGNQARNFVGSHSVTASEITAGTATFATTTSVPVGLPVTATLTPSSNNTSEFAANVLSANPFLVTTTVDSGLDTAPTPGSLRAAIINANTIAGQDTITFAIQQAPVNGVWTLNLVNNPLPAITQSVIIDATAGGFYQGSPAIVINGSGIVGNGLNLTTGSDGSRIRGLAIENFTQGAGIHIGSSLNSIQNNYLGTDATGTAAGLGNRQGILIDGAAANNSIGGLTSVGNLISGNTVAGVAISGAAAVQNVIQGNLIGTTAAGTAGLSNAAGVVIDASASNNSIGGGATNRGNVVAFNTGAPVTVNSGSGNLISLNSIFQNKDAGNTSFGIVIAAGANGDQIAPVITSVNPSGGNTTIQVDLTGSGYVAGTVLEFFASSSGDPAGAVGQAHIYLGSYSATPADVAANQATVSLAATVPFGQYVTATATTSNNTSEFAVSTAVANPFAVTTTVDTIIGGVPTPGSLRAAITNANASSGLITITFAIPGTGTHVINLTAVLPTLVRPVVIDGTSESGYVATPLVVIDGQSTLASGFTLGANSDGSTIRGLEIRNFTGDAVVVSSSNNLIGGATGQGNTIHDNGNGIRVLAGNGNQFAQNIIYAGGGISLASGTNDSQAAPTITSATSVPNLTTINYTFTAANHTGDYTLEFFASGTGGQAPAFLFLGQTTVVNVAANATVSGTAVLNPANLPAGLLASQSVTATVTFVSTAANHSTSEFAAPTALTDPYRVTSTADSGPGTLRDAIINANANTDPGFIPEITFVTSLAIVPTSPLPAITSRVTINGIGSNVSIDGSSLSTGAVGLDFETGSDRSLAEGLTLIGFQGDGVLINASNVSIGGTATGAGNTFGGTAANGQNVRVGSGVGNQILANTFFDATVVPPATQAPPDIVLAPGANGGIAQPVLVAASVPVLAAGAPGAPITLSLLVQANAGATVEVYLLDNANHQRVFVGSTTLVQANGNASLSGLTNNLGQFTLNGVTIDPNQTPSQQLVVTATDAALGTSIFSAPQGVSLPNVVTTTDDDGIGSLRQVLQYAIDHPSPSVQFITFAIASPPNDGAFYRISLVSPLPEITTPVFIDGFTQPHTSTAPPIEVFGGNLSYTYGDGPDSSKVDFGDGLILGTGSANSTIQGLSIYGFKSGTFVDIRTNPPTSYFYQGAGIRVLSNDNTITGNFLGFDSAKAITGQGNVYGILVGGPSLNDSAATVASTGNTILTNQISANLSSGIKLDGGGSNTVQSNLIGSSAFLSTTANQTGNGGDGILLDDSSNNVLGGENVLVQDTVTGGITGALTGNTIDGNQGFGINLTNGSASNTILGNTIGQSQSLITTDSSTIPTAWSINGQVIGDNQGNRTFGNVQGGIQIHNAAGNTIGGSIQGSVTTPGTIPGTNEIHSTANLVFGNVLDGITVNLPTLVGAAAAANTIRNNQVSYNGGNGILLQGPSDSRYEPTVITGNYIGTNPDGNGTVEGLLAYQGNLIAPPTAGTTLQVVSVGNGKNGVQLNGTTALISKNVLSGNGISGIGVGSSTSGVQDLSGASIDDNRIGVDRDGTSTYFIYPRITPVLETNDGFTTIIRYTAAPTLPTDVYRMGNILDGIVLDDVGGVAVTGGNVISGNLGRGLEIRKGGVNTVADNFIGTNAGGTQVADAVSPTQTLGNLGDGIFLIDVAAADRFTGNVISANRGFGFHSNNSSEFIVQNNHIGTNFDGSLSRDPVRGGLTFGNNADGILIDSATVTNNNHVSISDNLISNNSANGIVLLHSSGVKIVGNRIGTAGDGFAVYHQGELTPFGNSGNGIFLNESTSNEIGGTSDAERNIISGNLASGIVISGSASNPATAGGNRIMGNYIGLDVQGGPLANGVAGIVIISASGNTIGGTSAGARNVISGNRLYGVELASGAAGNSIVGNFIGTDATGRTDLVTIVDPNNQPVLDRNGKPMVLSTGNTSDGVFLIDSSGNTIGGTAAGSGNVISGNFANGARIFGRGSTGNLIAGNLIGLDKYGSTRVPNLGNGVLFDNVGSSIIVGKHLLPAKNEIYHNVISGNIQSGVMLIDSSGAGGSWITGNFIGTTADGNSAAGNGANGVLVFGSAENVIGSGPGGGNVISGNLQSGVFLYSAAAGALADRNLVSGNHIGTNADGTHAIANNADGVQIVNGNDNTISDNVLSGNLASGVNITAISDSQNPDNQLTARYNHVVHNILGLAADGVGTLAGSIQRNGVVIQDASNNFIGAPDAAIVANTNVPAPFHSGNVISGNLSTGVLINGASQSNSVQGNYIGVDKYGRQGGGFPDRVVGVFVNNTTANAGNNLIGGSAYGAGNLISGNGPTAGIGVEIFGPTTGVPANNWLLGNVIGLGLRYQGETAVGWGSAPNFYGVLIQNSAGNVIGGTTPVERNVISGNNDSGILIIGAGSTQNRVQGNWIGTDPTGSATLYTDNVPTQVYGVQIAGPGAYNNTVGNGGSFHDAGGNVISGNQIGVAVNLVDAADPSQRNLIQGNLVGVTPDGTRAAGNSEYGILANVAPYTVIVNNLASANGTGGIGIIANGRTFATVNSNVVGPGVDGGIPGVQPNGVVLIGASSNVIGGPGAGNLIKGNTSVGVYISKQDFNGVSYATPIDNSVRSNVVSLNKVYGILLYNAPNNVAPPFTGNGRNRIPRGQRPGGTANVVSGNGVDFLNFIARLNRNNSLQRSPKAKAGPRAQGHVKFAAPPQPQVKPLRVIMPKHK